MSKLDDLINNLCPNGVEYISLENCCDYVDYRGKTPKKTDRGIFLVTAKNIRQGYIDYESSKEYVSPDDYEEIMHRGLPEIGDVLFTTEAPCGFVAQIDNDKVALAQRVIKYRGHKGILNNSFLKYVLLGEEFQTKLHKISTGSTVEGIKGSRLHKMEIPVPPLEVQEEIVRILDKFTSLEAELEAELEARRKQYEYYRDSLLTFGDDVEWKTLGEIAKYSDSRIKNSDIQPYSYVSVENLLQQKKGVEFTNKIPEGNNSIEYLKEDILIGNIRPYLRKIWKADRNGGTNGDVLTIRILNDYKQRIDPKYLYYQLSSEDFFNYDNQHAKGAKMPRGSKDDVMKYKIPIPSILEQQRIVNILDRFESLCNDITSGLPAEIEARHKQYEYYRDKLLTFKRKSS